MKRAASENLNPKVIFRERSSKRLIKEGRRKTSLAGLGLSFQTDACIAQEHQELHPWQEGGGLGRNLKIQARICRNKHWMNGPPPFPRIRGLKFQLDVGTTHSRVIRYSSQRTEEPRSQQTQFPPLISDCHLRSARGRKGEQAPLGGRQGGSQAAREPGSQGARELGREGGSQGARELGSQGAREGRRVWKGSQAVEAARIRIKFTFLQEL